MSVSAKLLVDGEHEILQCRTHIKALFGPFLMGLVIALAGGFAVGRVGSVGGGWVRIALLVLAIVLLFLATILPFLRWFTWTYAITNLRLIEHRGIINRSGRIIPLSRVNDVAYEKSITDRLLGCGTLIIRDASEQAGLRLKDIPHIEDVHRQLSTLVLASQREEAPRGEPI